MAKILLIEDDFYLRRDLGILLREAGHEVLSAGTAKDAVQTVLSRDGIDLALLDLWLPDGDGFLVLEKIRARSRMPVLFLTACDDEESVIRGLNEGADDYITKPFRKAELLSRIAANLRRMEQPSEEMMLISDSLVLNPATHTVTKDGKELSLRPAEYRLLLLMMENAGILLSRERLLMELDSDDAEEAVENNTLSVHISRLRKALPGDLIGTVRGFGYRFTGEVRKRPVY